MKFNKLQEYDPDFSAKCKDRFIEILNKNLLFMAEELTILEAILNKYPLLNYSEYADKHKLTPNGVKYKADNGLLPNVKVGGKNFVLDV